jgi:hypothetical protein
MNWPSDSIDGPRLAELLSEQWTEVGVDLELQASDPDALTAQCCPAFDFDVILWGWGSDPDPNLLLSVMTTAEIPTGSSETGYSNPEFDKILDQAATIVDDARREKALQKAMEIAIRDQNLIPLHTQHVIVATKKQIFMGAAIALGLMVFSAIICSRIDAADDAVLVNQISRIAQSLEHRLPAGCQPVRIRKWAERTVNSATCRRLRSARRPCCAWAGATSHSKKFWPTVSPCPSWSRTM